MSVKSLQRNVIALAAGAVMAGLTACTGGTAAPAPSTTTTAPAASAAPAVSTAPTTTGSAPSTTTAPPGTTTRAKPMFGPLGYGELKLGMSKKPALATGLLTVIPGNENAEFCGGYKIKGGGIAHISVRLGLAAIAAPGDARTAEGIGVGSTLVALGKAYPSVTPFAGTYYVAIADTDAQYTFLSDQGAKVGSMALELKKQDCYR